MVLPSQLQLVSSYPGHRTWNFGHRRRRRSIGIPLLRLGSKEDDEDDIFNDCCIGDDDDEQEEEEVYQCNEKPNAATIRDQILLSKQYQSQQQQQQHGSDDDDTSSSSSPPIPPPPAATTSSYTYLDDLTPPPVNFARNSILFSDNPSTRRRNNPVLDVWRFCRTYLPAVVTGAWPWRDGDRMDGEPVASLYNMAFVRIPAVCVGVVYWKNLLLDGHDLVMDFGLIGDGPQVMNPILVMVVLCFILL
jgi:hypothetical protein